MCQMCKPAHAPLRPAFRLAAGGTYEVSFGNSEQWSLPPTGEAEQEQWWQEQREREPDYGGDIAAAVADATQHRSQNAQKKQEALEAFSRVVAAEGIKVLKHHSRGGAAVRMLHYDPSHSALAWDSHRLFFFTMKRSVPLSDVLDVEREGSIVWVKTLHMGEFGLEMPLQEDAELVYLAMDALLDERTGPCVGPSNKALRLPIFA
eukprot:TRINITY_DN666_c0_g1_i2.p1 TRINITY_DN666_c0_g1~~TRINITY_DN666_c0_g1_i2.p1  ORF type:complete len:205 (-),score=51.15 TRINITY_DN666_c0_g1_i2:779-1393(-)